MAAVGLVLSRPYFENLDVHQVLTKSLLDPTLGIPVYRRTSIHIARAPDALKGTMDC